MGGGRGGQLGFRMDGVRVGRRPPRRFLLWYGRSGRRGRWRCPGAEGRDGRRDVVGTGLRVSEGSRGGRGQCVVGRIWSRPLEVPADHSLELLQRARFNVELPIQVVAHLALHLVDLPQRKHTLTNDTPGFVRVGVIADDLGSNHERRDEEAVPGGTACGDEPRLQPLE